MKRKLPKIYLTLDVEEWFHANYKHIDISKYSYDESNLELNIDRFISLCANYNIQSTCFVLGQVAEKKPSIVKKLFRAGHEIASHGYSHQLIYDMSPKDFKKDLFKSCDILQNITGEKVLGFRAPCWSVNKNNISWFYSILQEAGIRYSSSVYPAKTFLYGIPGFPEIMHYPDVNGTTSDVLEVPVPVVSIFGKKVGFSGGFFLRFFPLWFIERSIKSHFYKGKVVFIYLHPREIDKNEKRIALSPVEKFIHYAGVNGCYHKLERIIENQASGRLKDLICAHD